MIVLILILSFLLHIITIAALYQISKNQKNSKQMDAQEMIGIMEDYLQAIKTENQKLANELDQTADQAENHQNNRSIEWSVNQPQHSESRTSEPTEDNTQLKNVQTDNVQDQFEASLTSRMLQLHQEGLSNEEIASKLNCGKTEVALVVKMHAKNT